LGLHVSFVAKRYGAYVSILSSVSLANMLSVFLYCPLTRARAHILGLHPGGSISDPALGWSDSTQEVEDLQQVTNTHVVGFEVFIVVTMKRM
jgi:hypothetical protein